MRKNYLLLLFSFLLLFSCNEKENVEFEPLQSGSVDTTSTVVLSTKERIALRFMRSKTSKISEFEAYDKAISFISEVHNSTNKSLAFRSLSSCIPLTTKKSYTTLKSSELIDTLAYVINFDDSLGYVIVPADIRVGDVVLAFSEYGNIDLDQENDGFALCMGYAYNYMISKIDEFDSEYDSLKSVLIDKVDIAEGSNKKKEIGETDPYPDPLKDWWHTIDGVMPLTAVEWGQREPYYKYTPTVNGIHTYTGCVAVAVAQIMAKWQYPNTIDGYNMNWTEMVKYTGDISRNSYFGNKWSFAAEDYENSVGVDNIARLMSVIGTNVGMNYGLAASSAKTADAANWLRRIGYNIDDECEYDFEKVKQSIDKGCIVLARGNTDKKTYKIFGITYETIYLGGHAWNYDGYLIQKKEYEEPVYDGDRCIGTKRLAYFRDYVHVNWGWDGEDNGFYLSGVFNCANKNRVIPSYGNKSLYNFQYNLTMFPNIRR